MNITLTRYAWKWESSTPKADINMQIHQPDMKKCIPVLSSWGLGRRLSRACCRYVGKLLPELEAGALAVFSAPSDRDRVTSVLADLAKTASDFHVIASKGLDLLANGILPRLRYVLPQQHVQACADVAVHEPVAAAEQAPILQVCILNPTPISPDDTVCLHMYFSSAAVA